MLRNLYHGCWRCGIAGAPCGSRIAFAEASFFPIPRRVADPMALARPRGVDVRADLHDRQRVRGALGISSLRGVRSTGEAVLALYGYGEKFARFRHCTRSGAVVILIKA